MSDVKTYVHAVYAAFGDAAVLEFAGPGQKRRLYLVDGGPIGLFGAGTKAPGRIKRLTKSKISTPYYQYLLYTLTQLGRIPNTSGIKLDGVVVTHPHADHMDGVERLFRLLLPQQFQDHAEPKDKKQQLICNGPVLLTKKFQQGTFSNFLVKSNFETSTSMEDILNAFGNELVFTFPTSGGVVYKREKPLGDDTQQEPSAGDRRHVQAPYKDCPKKKWKPNIESSVVNQSSIILYTSKGGKICLSGDAYGFDILQTLRRHDVGDLDIFKLPHHGSSDNSNLGNVSPPSWAMKNLALMMLLSIPLQPDWNQVPPHELKDIKHLFKRLEEITSALNVQRVADAFLKVLAAKKNPAPAELFDRMQELHMKVVIAINENKDARSPCEALKPLKSFERWVELRNAVVEMLGSIAKNTSPSGYRKAKQLKSEISTIVGELMGESQIFKSFFEEKIGIVKFFESFHAKTYYVSSDGSYNHPSPQVINGIIKAAMNKPERRPCRIVLTCGQALEAASLLDVNDAVYKGWNKLVPIYYLKDDVSLKLDPEEDPNVTPKNAGKFDSDDTVRANVAEQLKKNPGFTIPYRSFIPELDVFYVKTQGKKSSKNLWLGAKQDDATLFFTEKSTLLRVSNNPSDIRAVTLKSNTSDGMEKNVWLERAGKGEFYIKGKPNGDYVACEDGAAIAVKFSQEKEEGSLFSFENKFLTGTWGVGDSKMPVREYLISVGHQGDIKLITVRHVLESLLGVLNMANLTDSFPKDFIGALALDQLVDLRESFVEIALSSDFEVVSSHVKVVLPTPTFQFNSMDVMKLEIVVKQPLSACPKLQMLISTSLSGVKFTVDASDLLKERIPSVDMFLNELGGVPRDHRDKLTLGNLLIPVVGFFSLESLANCLPSQFVESGMLLWLVDRRLSTVKYFKSPLAVEVLFGDFYVHIPQERNWFTFEHTLTAEIVKMHVVVKEPRTFNSDFLIESDARISGVSVTLRVTCSQQRSPEVIIEFPGACTLSMVSKTLGLFDNIQDLSLPGLNKIIKNLKLSKPRITVVQDVPNTRTAHLSSLSFDVSLDNWYSVLPRNFPSPSESKASIHISNLFSGNYYVGVEIDFNLPVVSSVEDDSFLIAKLSVLPVEVAEDVRAPSHVVGVSLRPSSSHISIQAALQAVGGSELEEALASSCPNLARLLETVLIDELCLEINSHSMAIESTTLSLVVPEWKISEKLTMYDMHLLVQYTKKQLYVKAVANLLVFDKFLCRAAFSLPMLGVSGSLIFENTDALFTLKEMIDGAELSSADDVPVVNKVLDLKVSKVAATCEIDGASFRLTNISVVVEKDALKIGSLEVSKIKLEVSYANDPESWSITFSLQGYLNSKVFTSLSYDTENKELRGSYKFRENSSADECLKDHFRSEMENFTSGTVFDAIKDFYVQEAKVIVSFPSEEEWRLKEFVLAVQGSLTLGPFKLKRVCLQYVKESVEDRHQKISVLGNFERDDRGLTFLVELTCVGYGSDNTSFNAVVRSQSPGSLKLSSLLPFLDFSIPEVPPIDGTPNFLDIELEEVSFQFNLSPFHIEKLDVTVTTSQSLVILEKPRIQLKKARLEYHYNATKEPANTSVYVAGNVLIAGVQLDVKLTKEAKGRLLLEGRLEDSGDISLDFEKAATELSSNIAVSLPENVMLTSFYFRLETNEETYALFLEGKSQRTWSVDAGLTTCTVTELGGRLHLQKLPTSDVLSGDVCLLGKLNLPGSLAADVQICYNSKKDLIASGNVHKPREVNLDGITRVLNPTSGANTFWQELVPSNVDTCLRSPRFEGVSMYINFTQKTLLLYVKVAELGSGVFFVKKPKADDKSEEWGFLFAVRLAADFRFSTLSKHLSPVDGVISVQNASLSVVSLDEVKISEIYEECSEFYRVMDLSMSKQEDPPAPPFADLNIQNVTEMKIRRGITICAKLDIAGAKSKLMSNMSQMQRGKTTADIVLFAYISESIPESAFMAHIEEMELFGGCLTFSDITLLYKPCTSTRLSLSGRMNLRLTEESNPLVINGSLKIADTEANFSMELGADTVTIAKPFGMFGFSIEEARLELTWHFDQDQPAAAVPDYRLEGVVRISKSTSTPEKPEIAATLDGSILFKSGRPEVARIALNSSNPLKIDDIFASLFGEQWPAGYLEVAFKGGEIYCARSDVEINDKRFKEGFNANTEIEIMERTFGVEVSIDSSGIFVKGYTKPEIDLIIATLAGNDFAQNMGPEICISRRNGKTKFMLTAGVILLQEKIGISSVDYKVQEKCFGGEVKYKGELLGIKEPSIGFEWSKHGGFIIRHWPVLLPLGTVINFASSFAKLSEMIDSPCEKLIGLTFDHVVKTKCRLKLSQVPVTDSHNPDAWFALKLQGIQEITIVTNNVSITVDFPEMIVAIDKPKKHFKLSDLPGFLIKEILKNSLELVKQVFTQPKQLTKFFMALGTVKLSRKVLSGLICRGVQSPNVTQLAATEAETMQSEADMAEQSFNEASESLLQTAGEGGSITSLASMAVSVTIKATAALAVLGSLISFLAGIIAFFSGKTKEKKRAEERQKAIEEEQQRAVKVVEDRLVVLGLSLVFLKDDEVEVSWEPLEKDIEYSFRLICTDIDGKEAIAQDVKTKRTKVIVKDDVIKYNTRKVMAIVQASYTCNGTTFQGVAEFLSQETEIHLRSPSHVTIECKQGGKQLHLTFSRVEYATHYEGQVVSNSGTIIGKATIPQPPTNQEGRHVFIATELISEHVGECKVRVSARRHGSKEADFTDSRTVNRVDYPSKINLCYDSRTLKLSIKWFVRDVNDISSYLCEVFSVRSKNVVYSKVVPGSEPTNSTTNHELCINELTEKAHSPYDVRVCSLGGIKSLASAFVESEDHMSFLPRVHGVEPSYDPESNHVTVSWVPVPEASFYKIAIRRKSDTSCVVANVVVDGKKKKKKGKKTSAKFIIENDKLKAEECYEVVVVAEGLDIKHLPSGNAVSTTTLAQLPMPASVEQKYLFDKKQIMITFQPVPRANRHLVEVFKESNPKQVSGKHISQQANGGWPATVSQPIDVQRLKLCSDARYQSRVFALGNKTWINSSPRATDTVLRCSQAPTEIALTYNQKTKSISISFGSSFGAFTARVVDVSHQSKTIGFKEIPVGHPSQIQIPLDISKEPQGAVYQALLQTIGDAKHLPSEVMLSNEVRLLDPPLEVAQDYRSGILTIMWTCVQSAIGYDIKIFDTESGKVAKEVNVAQGLTNVGAQLEQRFDVDSLALENKGMYKTSVTSLGNAVLIGGATSTTKTSIPCSLSPEAVEIKYNIDTHSLDVLCTQVSEAVLYMIGIAESALIENADVKTEDCLVEWKEVGAPSDDPTKCVEAKFDVTKLFPSFEVSYRGIGRVLEGGGNPASLPGGFCFSDVAIPWLEQPFPIKLTFSPAESLFKAMWSSVHLALSYFVEILRIRKDEQNTVVFSAETKGLSCNFDASEIHVQDHDKFVARVRAIGDETVISCFSVALSEDSIACQHSPTDPQITRADDEAIKLRWRNSAGAAFEVGVWRISESSREKVVMKRTNESSVTWSPADLGMNSPGQYRMAVRSQGSLDKLPSRFSEFEFPLVIMEAPVVTVETQSHGAVVQWKPVESNISRHFSNYVVSYQLEDSNQWEHVTVDLSQTEKAVSNLQSDKEYSFCISAAHSDRGMGIRSPSASIRTKPGPGIVVENLLENPNFRPAHGWDDDGSTKDFITEPWQLVWQGGDGYKLQKIKHNLYLWVTDNESPSLYLTDRQPGRLVNPILLHGDTWCVTASNAWCWRVQIVDLLSKGFTPDYLDHVKPVIRVHERFACQTVGGGVCDFKVSLLDSNKRDLPGKNSFFYSGEIHPNWLVDLQNADTWQLVEHSFSDYSPGLRFIRFEDGMRTVNATRPFYDIRAYAPTMEIAKM